MTKQQQILGEMEAAFRILEDAIENKDVSDVMNWMDKNGYTDYTRFTELDEIEARRRIMEAAHLAVSEFTREKSLRLGDLFKQMIFPGNKYLMDCQDDE